MATLKKRILQNISQTETAETTNQVFSTKINLVNLNFEFIQSEQTTTATLILDSKNQSIPPSAHKVRLVESATLYRRFTDFVKRLKTLKTLREYNEILVEFTDRLILFRNCIDDCIT